MDEDRALIVSGLGEPDPRYPAPVDGKCNAQLRTRMERCKNIAGFKTAHEGAGRCFLHGGRNHGVVKHGERAKTLRTPLADAIEIIEHSPELLSLDREVAVAKAILNKQTEEAILADEEYQNWLFQMENLGPDDEPPEPPKRLPTIDMDLAKLVGSLTKTAYDMRFSRRFSIPISEVRDILAQVANTFNEIAKIHGLSEEARNDFVHRLRTNVRISTPVEDGQLMRAGNGRFDDD